MEISTVEQHQFGSTKVQYMLDVWTGRKPQEMVFFRKISKSKWAAA